MALQRTRRPRIRSGRSLRSLGSPLSFWSLGDRRGRRWGPAVLELGALVIAGLLISCATTKADDAALIFYADLDTKEGHYSMWRAEGLESMNGCSFEAELVRVYKHRQWLPVATYALLGSAEGNRISFQLWRPNKTEVFKARLVTVDEAGTRTGELSFTAKVGDRFPVSIRWAGSLVEFLVGKQVVASAERSFAVRRLEISVSTAQLKVWNLTFQQQARE